jgi:hypothetical protein
MLVSATIVTSLKRDASVKADLVPLSIMVSPDPTL